MTLPYVATAALCEVRQADCVTLDRLFQANRLTVQVAPSGVVTSTCVGITAGPKPATKQICRGDLDHPCNLVMEGGFDFPVNQHFVANWKQIVQPNGLVTLTCRFDPNQRD